MSISAETFRLALRETLRVSEDLGLVAIELNSGNFHRRIGGYPGADHRMPVCCDVMRAEMTAMDSIVAEPESGKGASLVIRYVFPR